MILRLCGPGPAGDGEAAVHGHFDLLAKLVGPLGRADWTVNLVLADDKRMESLNGDFRHRPGVTDVLSFSYLEDEGPGAPGLVTGDGFAARDLWCEAGPTVEAGTEAVGEIILAPGFVAERCRVNGWPLREEICLLVIHGALHIMGWDHEKDADRTAMQIVEKEILDGWNISHPLWGRS